MMSNTTPPGPDAAGVDALLRRLREAADDLAELSLGTRVEAVTRVLEAWADPTSAFRLRMLEEHPEASGLSRANVGAGLELALAEWTKDAFERLIRNEATRPDPLPGVTAVLHGGVIPMPTLLDVLAPLVLGSAVLSKPASRDRVTPRLVGASLDALAPEIAGGFAIADFRHDDVDCLDALLAADRVVVTGGDDAIAAIRRRIPSGTNLIAHGHKLSIAVLGPTADLHDAARRLAIDVTLWDQLGCLSPVACWSIGNHDRAREFGRAVADALEARERAAPRGEVDRGAAARIANERSEAELRDTAQAEVALHVGETWTVVVEPTPTPRAAPLHRFLRIHSVVDVDALVEAIAPISPHVAGLAHAGLDEASAARCVQSTGASHAAPFGRLQAPPLDWARDGLGVLDALS